ncbi:hypothetical protein SSX86_032448 [Deinandra increscens subsp. villosa]|uniref:Integrase catalytic domain-containing protein n=1 Tax=Deinandra increscens subsp. villosa TaxID=3103831 RepID=A0AAP0C739_9ASTR
MFCGEKGIDRQYSAPYTPQQNGVAERRNRTLIEAARTMMCEAKLPIFFWAEAVNTACYVQNRVLLNKRHEQTPYQIVYGEKPKVGYFKSFGCPCTVLIQSDVGKFEAKADECYFVGYSANSAYRVYNKTTKVIIEAFNVDWMEDNPTDAGAGPDWIFDYGSLFEGFNFSNVFHNLGEEEDIVVPSSDVRPHVDRASAESSRNATTDIPECSGTRDAPVDSQGPGMSDNVVNANLPVNVSVPDVQVSRINRDHPLSNVVGPVTAGVTTRSRTGHINFCMYSCFISQIEPPNVMVALKDPSWMEAMHNELNQFSKLGVWRLVKRPDDKKVIPTRWLYKNKKDDSGIIVRNKARLIVQGHRQVHGIDYDEVYAPVARLEAIRIFLAVASYLNFTVHQMDVKTAFLYAEMNEEVYVTQPPGFIDEENPDHVYLLDKALYGLHQAPRTWYETLSNHLVENGYTRGVVDQTLFRKRVEEDIIMVQVYVDDIIYGSTNEELCTEFEEIMKKKFEMSDQGEMSFFLALQVKQDESGILIHQEKYVNEILEKFKMKDCKPISTPMASRPLLSADLNGESVSEFHYRSMIGSLMYLTASRPDIMHAVCVCARYQANPKLSHLSAVKRIFRYLKGRPRLGLWYPKNTDFQLYAFTDSDYGGSDLDRKSTTGGCQYLGDRLISWQSKKQHTVSKSTAEAEYVAASAGTSQVVWIQNQLTDYGMEFVNTPIFCDNAAALEIVKNPVQHSKTKHIDIKVHFIRDCFDRELIQLQKVSSDQNVSDIFTKPLPRPNFESCVEGLKMIAFEE